MSIKRTFARMFYLLFLSQLSLYAANAKQSTKALSIITPIVEMPSGASSKKQRSYSASSLHPYLSAGIMHLRLKDKDTKERIEANAAFLKAGVALNRYLSLEALIASSFGNSRYKGYGTSKDINARFKQYALYLKAAYPMKNLNPYLLIGAAQHKITRFMRNTQTQNAFSYGIGLAYAINDTLSIEAFYKQDYNAKGFGNRASQDAIRLTSYGMNLTYTF